MHQEKLFNIIKRAAIVAWAQILQSCFLNHRTGHMWSTSRQLIIFHLLYFLFLCTQHRHITTTACADRKSLGGRTQILCFSNWTRTLDLRHRKYKLLSSINQVYLIRRVSCVVSTQCFTLNKYTTHISNMPAKVNCPHNKNMQNPHNTYHTFISHETPHKYDTWYFLDT